MDLLADNGDSAQAPIPVALETSRGLLVACLRGTGRKVYAIAVARYRERHSVARAKSDHADAMTLANILRLVQDGNADSIAAITSGASGRVCGANRARIVPSGPIRNFSKFHRISPV